jgi:cytoskeletal protein RodZ
MTKTLLLAGAALMTLSGAAIAQDTMPAPTTPPDSTTPATDATAAPPTTPAPDASSTASPTGSTPAEAGATPDSTTAPTVATEGAAGANTGTAGTTDAAAATASTGAAASVQADWGKYDKENTGYLTPLQFGSWVLASRGQDMTAQVEKTRQSKKAGLPAVKVLNATAGEFVKADADHDRKITPAELSAYLGA